jgi:hypothetical protein
MSRLVVANARIRLGAIVSLAVLAAMALATEAGKRWTA